MPADKNPPVDEPLLPELAEPAWDDAIEAADETAVEDDILVEDLSVLGEDEEESLEEDDDNPYQNSDDALPDDDEEVAIDQKLREAGDGRFSDS